MTGTQMLDQRIYRLSFWAAIILILAGVLSVFFPLDAPETTFVDRMIWFSKNVDAFAMGWVVQMIAMLTLSGVFAGTAWQAGKVAPISSALAGIALLFATMAFLIPKFIAIWAIPQMVAASSTVTVHTPVAEQLFQMLNPSLSFSLFTSFDYLGFWMYSIFGLLAACPLFNLSLAAKISAVSLGLFGVLYHLLVFGVVFGAIGTSDVTPYAESISILLLIPVVSMAFHFRSQLKKKSHA